MREVLQSIFGQYVATPIYQVITSDGQASSVQVGSVIDVEYIAGVVLFALCLISLFKIVGAVLKR